ncbi:protein aveugle [Adelges cooleyi]|uniref:protein aveugle n=1 Tax=Adelges cooleyi TaxID=133065 RepID=UPI00217FC080|nr:protein aveugle [Adelges cooleyi]XP_050434256.1 protein aveugle [Adelges cooleyi]XP_050434257.1 protein aveugle [Adelges cooleyi]XP_050434258.1 protein aveugle [Adelges cooleyi]
MILEDNQNVIKPRNSRAARPKVVYQWTVQDVQKWFRRHCYDYYVLYGDKFLQHEIIGRALIRINENQLYCMGITNPDHNQEICREILKLRLKTYILEFRDLERNNLYD